MANKINTDNPKHHKYVDTNKYERKKNDKNIKFDFIHKVYDVTVLIKTAIIGMGWFRTSRIYSDTYRVPNYHSYHHCNYNYNTISGRVGKGLIIWNDCNHKTFIVKKKNGFMKNRYNNKLIIFKFK